MESTKQHIRKTRRLRGRTKRSVIALIAVLFTLTISATALADSGRGTGTPGGQPQQGGQQGQTPKSSPDPTSSDKGRQSGQTNGARSAEWTGANVDKIKEAIAALTDETVQANLTALLEAYETAAEAKQTAIQSNDTTDLDSLSSAVDAAKEALDAALVEAGVSTDELYGVPEQAQDGTGRMENRPALNATAISEAIAALDDTDANKATLTSLLDAYETAIKTQNGADATSMTEDEKNALADATHQAELALEEALKNAGLAEGPILEQNQRQIQEKTEAGEGLDQTHELNVPGEDVGGTQSESNSIFSAFLQWLRNLVQ